MLRYYSDEYTVKPVLRGSPKGRTKTGCLKQVTPLILVHLHYSLVQGTQKMWLLKTGDPLIEVTT